VTTASPPLYLQLQNELAEKIASGTYAIGDFLPTEAELCVRHGVSRHTVRAALRRLDDLGMIERRAGIGTRVVSDQPVDAYRPLAATSDYVIGLVDTTKIVDIETTEVTAGAALARQLRCRPGSRWLRLAGPRVERGRGALPVCFSEQYLRADLARDERNRRGLERGEFDLEEHRRYHLEQEISAALLDEEMATALEAPVGSAALVVMRRHTSPSQALVAVGVHTHPADRTTIRWELENPHG